MPGNVTHLDRSYIQLARVHALGLQQWIERPATDYWLKAGPGALTATTGFTLTSLVATVGSAADLITSSDVGTPASIDTDASGDLLQSPAIFGDYANALAAAHLLGTTSLPKRLYVDMYGAFGTASANEPRSAMGLWEDGGTVSVQADQLAIVCSDGTNFAFRNGDNAVVTSTLAVDNVPHFFRMILDKPTGVVLCYIDGVQYGGATGLTLEADEFPAKFGIHALTTNRPNLAWAHIYYRWS